MPSGGADNPPPGDPGSTRSSRPAGPADRSRTVTGAPADETTRSRAEDDPVGVQDTTCCTPVYARARAEWEPGRLNVVVVLTDGRNEDGDGIDLPTLLAGLREHQDPRRPLPLIAIGIGPDASLSELTTMASATGGRAFTAPDPTALPEIFYTALSGMLCQPPLCDT